MEHNPNYQSGHYGRQEYDRAQVGGRDSVSQQQGLWNDPRYLGSHPYFESSLRAQYRRRVLEERLHYYRSQKSFVPKSPWIQQPASSKPAIDEKGIREGFNEIMNEIEEKSGKENLCYPTQVLLLAGPPGSGKTTLAEAFQEKLDYNMVVGLRKMCQIVMHNNRGSRFNIQPVTKMLLEKLFTCPKDEATRMIIDDFSSISIARIFPLIIEYAEKLRKDFPDAGHPKMKLKICGLVCSKDTCIDRKLKDSSSGTYKSYSTLYKKFNKRTMQVLDFLSDSYIFDEVNSNDNIENVQIRAIIEIEKEKNGTTSRPAAPAAAVKA